MIGRPTLHVLHVKDPLPAGRYELRLAEDKGDGVIYWKAEPIDAEREAAARRAS